MGIYTVTCEICQGPFQWFSGNTGQNICEECRISTNRYQAEKMSKSHVPMADVQILLDCLKEIIEKDVHGEDVAKYALSAFAARTRGEGKE